MFEKFENLADPFVEYDETRVPPTTVGKFISSYCGPFRQILILAAIFAVLAALSEIVLIYAFGWLVDVMQGDPATAIADNWIILLGLVVFIVVIKPLIHFIDVLILNNGLMPNIATIVRWRAHKHVLKQSIGWFENDFAGRIANRVMQTPRSTGEVVFQIFDALSYATAYLIGAFVLLLEADWRLTLPLILWIVLYGMLMKWIIRRVETASQASSDARSVLNGRVVDSYTNIHSVKMFASEGDEIAYAKEAIVNTRDTVIKEMRIYSIMDFGINILNAILIVSVVGWAIYLWSIGSATAGVVAAAITLVLRLSAMTGWIMWAITNVFSELGVVKEGMETIAQPIALVDVPNAKPLAISKADIEFAGVSHHYGRTSGGLDNLSLKIAAGEKVGLVGRSGAGKSSLLKLLLRFYDLEKGQILIDGQDIMRITQDSLRSQIGVVQQESSLLHRSIRANIAYGDRNASEADIIKAAQNAHADEFIADLQDPKGNTGYDAEVGERGVKLSGGQRQRISLARVLLKNAPILLLDEATSALDSEVEAAIQETLYSMMKGKTVIAIAHRLSTIAQMDRILVMDKGQIVEQGTHDFLLAQGGLYSELWARQSGGFLDYEE